MKVTLASRAVFSSDCLATNPQAGSIRKVESTVRPLDEVLPPLGIKKMDLLEIDVEGYEFEALQRARNTLSRTESMIVEVSLSRAAKSMELPLLKLLSILQEHGFQIEKVIPSGYDPNNEWQLVEFNVLAHRS
jgi:hypothetical protein